jgi:hypothetical protein
MPRRYVYSLGCFFQLLQEGAGGSYTWGKPGDTEPGPAALDRNDPNYDSGTEVCIFTITIEFHPLGKVKPLCKMFKFSPFMNNNIRTENFRD